MLPETLDLMREIHPTERWDESWTEGLLLVLSNFALLPVVTRLLRRRDWATAANYLGVLLVSSLYHGCRAGFLCPGDYKMLRIADYLFVYRSVVWSFAALVARPRIFGLERSHVMRGAFYFSVMVPMTLILLTCEHTSPWVPFTGFIFPLAVAAAVTNAYRQPFINDWVWGTLGLALFSGGGVLGFALPSRDYNWAHWMWHVFVMLSMYCFERAKE